MSLYLVFVRFCFWLFRLVCLPCEFAGLFAFISYLLWSWCLNGDVLAWLMFLGFRLFVVCLWLSVLGFGLVFSVCDLYLVVIGLWLALLDRFVCRCVSPWDWRFVLVLCLACAFCLVFVCCFDVFCVCVGLIFGGSSFVFFCIYGDAFDVITLIRCLCWLFMVKLWFAWVWVLVIYIGFDGIAGLLW